MQFLKIRRPFCFFKNQISDKYGKICCRYNQDGKPMEFQAALKTFTDMNQCLQGWKLKENNTRLVRHLYAEDYPSAFLFLREVVQIDKNQFLQCPTFSLEGGELLTLKLYSVSLNGLSSIDFQLALRINLLPLKKFHLLSIEDETNYKKEIRKIRMERQAAEIRKMLDEERPEKPK